MCELSAVRFSIVSPLSVNQQPSSLTWNVLEELFYLSQCLIQWYPVKIYNAFTHIKGKEAMDPFVRIKASREPSGLRVFVLLI